MIEGKNFLDMFIPPADYTTELAIGTTMSQNTDALELIMQALTGKGVSQLKTVERGIKFVLIYDNTSPIVECQKLGGLFPIRLSNKNRLLHAKMALIKYKKGANTLYRLIVMTGNFTMASLNQQIEMIWSHDYETSDPYLNDLIQAANFLQKLLHNHTTNYSEVQNNVDILIEEIQSMKKGKITSRFLHSIDSPLMVQVLEKMKTFKKERYKHNNVIFGSPFLQENLSKDNFVINEFIDKLSSEEIIHSKTNYFLQTISANLTRDLGDACKNRDIEIFTTNDKRRTLHSKYILLSNQRDGVLYDNVFYVGSGNLTMNGFRNTQSNIECGLIFKHPEAIEEADLYEAFYCSEKMEYEALSDELSGAREDSKIESFNLAVLSARLEENSLTLTLSSVEDFVPFDVISDNISLAKVQAYPGESLKISLQQDTKVFDTVVIADDNNQRYPVMVFDENGLPQAIDVIKRSLEEVFSLLKTYPNIDVEAENDEVTQEIDYSIVLNQASEEEVINQRKSFSLYHFTELIEHIAKENETLSIESMVQWANTLKFTLIECLKEEEKKKLICFGSDKLKILKCEGFAPIGEPFELKPYLDAIESVIKDWESI